MEKPWKATVFPSDMIQKCDGCSSHGVKHQRLPAHHRQRLEIDPGPRRPRASASRRFRKPLLLHLWGWGSGPTGMIKSVKICGFQKPVATCEKLRWVRPLVSVLGHQEILLQDMNPTWSVRNLGIPWNEAFQDILESSILWELLVTVPVSTQFPLSFHPIVLSHCRVECLHQWLVGFIPQIHLKKWRGLRWVSRPFLSLGKRFVRADSSCYRAQQTMTGRRCSRAWYAGFLRSQSGPQD